MALYGSSEAIQMRGAMIDADLNQGIDGRGVAHEALRAIGVRIELSSGNIEPLLHEIRQALWLLLNEGTRSSIDLSSIPLAAGEEERILAVLGRGEACGAINVCGATELVETNFPGVWVITHFDVEGDMRARFIEVTRVPEILCSHPADIEDAHSRLADSLKSCGALGACLT